MEVYGRRVGPPTPAGSEQCSVLEFENPIADLNHNLHHITSMKWSALSGFAPRTRWVRNPWSHYTRQEKVPHAPPPFLREGALV